MPKASGCGAWWTALFGVFREALRDRVATASAARKGGAGKPIRRFRAAFKELSAEPRVAAPSSCNAASRIQSRIARSAPLKFAGPTGPSIDDEKSA